MDSLENSATLEGLRQRSLPAQAKSSEEARQAVLRLNALEEKSLKEQRHKKTYGRTAGGTVFIVPETYDVISQLLSPSQPKNITDLFILTVVFSLISLLWTLPRTVRIPTFGVIFVFWRLCYNVGIGWLLRKQSNEQTLVRWAKKSRLFGNPPETRYPKFRAFIKSELEKKVANDYSYEQAPLEYNTWLVFRRVVDLILVCDSTSYVLFALACGARPDGEALIITVLRWLLGSVLLWFSLWIKADAHRVVKDFAWYWGDFFFLVDQDLTFDGAYELAPHPMYSLGYVWLYATSLLMASHKVMFMSIFAHAAQFAFLVLIEAPHIEKTYNAPSPRKQLHDVPQSNVPRPTTSRKDSTVLWSKPGLNKHLETHSALHLDVYRVTDISTILVLILMVLLTIVTPTTGFYQGLFVTSAVLCRIWFSIGIGYLLNRQSTKKRWTRHFLKHGESTGEAWRQWKGTYLISMIMCYATFGAAAWRSYTPPSTWDDGVAILKHTIGLALVSLQIWVAISVYDQLGEFGWFYGDYFFDSSPKLTYGGIYRFLNNPERVLGLAGVWGTALCTDSRAIFAIAGLSQLLGILVLEFVERPHMMKLYGRHLRQDSGLVRSLKRSLPPPLRQWQDRFDHMLGDVLDLVEDFLDTTKPQLEAGLVNVVEPTKGLLSRHPARLSESNLELETSGLNPKDYALELEGEQMQWNSGSADSIVRLEYGSPIKVKWTASVHHSRRDWIGLYSLAARNTSREVTHVSSKGRWIATNFDEYDESTSEEGLISSDVRMVKANADSKYEECFSGEMVFSGDKLWWEQGIFEFRYHHNGKHNVMAISQPFEIQIPRYNEEDLELVDTSGESISSMQNEELIRRAIEKALLPVVRNCFDRDPNIAPMNPTETFGGHVERDGKYARRAVYAIQHMFGIEFAPQVVKADGQVSNLAWRILEAQKVLQPYSMSKSRGTSTPTE